MVEIMTKDGRMPIYTQRRSADNDSSAAFFFFSSTLLLLIKNLICHAIHRVCVVYWKWKVVLLLLTRTFGIFEKLSLRNSRYFVSLESFCLLCQFGLKSIICKHSFHGWLFMCICVVWEFKSHWQTNPHFDYPTNLFTDASLSLSSPIEQN